jgi:hypothetical protein
VPAVRREDVVALVRLQGAPGAAMRKRMPASVSLISIDSSL